MTMTITNWKTRLLRWLTKGAIWTLSFALLTWLLGFQPIWQLIVLVAACMVIDNILDDWLPTSSHDEEHRQALIAAEEAGYQRGVSETKMRSYTTGKPA